MIDLNETKQARALLKEWCEQGMACISTPVKYGQLLDLMNRLASAEKDAARYRWLREQTCSGWEIDGEETSHIDVTMWRNDGFDNCNNGESLFGESMDAAIDEAMSVNQT